MCGRAFLVYLWKRNLKNDVWHASCQKMFNSDSGAKTLRVYERASTRDAKIAEDRECQGPG